MRKLLIALALGLSVSTAVSAEETSITHSEKVGGWVIDSYMTVQTKKFTHCVAYTIYPARNVRARQLLRADFVGIHIKWFESSNLGFGLIGIGWKLTPGNLYRIDFNFSNGDTFNIDAKAENEEVVQVEINAAGAGEWFVRFAESNWVEIKLEGTSLGQFNLNKSREALKLLGICYAGSSEGQAAADGSFGSGRPDATTDGFGSGRVDPNNLGENGADKRYPFGAPTPE